MARFWKVRVDEFWLGIPPKAKSLFRDKKWTEYTLNWIPLGGFVRLKWEDAESIEGQDTDSFAQKGYFIRSGILLAGVTMNFLLAWIIFIGLFVVGSQPFGINTYFETSTHSKFLPTFEDAKNDGTLTTSGIVFYPLTGSVAYEAGLRDGDTLHTINGQKLDNPDDVTKIIQKSPEVKLEISRSWSLKDITIIPKDKKIGSYVWYADIQLHEIRAKSFSDAIIMGSKEFKEHFVMTVEMFRGLGQKIFAPRTPTERTEAVNSMSWPIGLGNLFVNMVDAKVATSLIFVVAALLSLNLGFFNLLPLPALDGGRWLTITIWAILGLFGMRKEKYILFEKYFHAFWFLLLILLSIFVAFKDVIRIFIP